MIKEKTKNIRVRVGNVAVKVFIKTHGKLVHYTSCGVMVNPSREVESQVRQQFENDKRLMDSLKARGEELYYMIDPEIYLYYMEGEATQNCIRRNLDCGFRVLLI